MSVYNNFNLALGIPPSTIYAVVQFCCIVVNHALKCGIVFGWPFHYTKSCFGTKHVMPVGLSALLLGAVSIKCMDRMELDATMERMLVGVLWNSNKQKEESVLVEEEEEEKEGIVFLFNRHDHYRIVQLRLVEYSQQTK